MEGSLTVCVLGKVSIDSSFTAWVPKTAGISCHLHNHFRPMSMTATSKTLAMEDKQWHHCLSYCARDKKILANSEESAWAWMLHTSLICPFSVLACPTVIFLKKRSFVSTTEKQWQREFNFLLNSSLNLLLWKTRYTNFKVVNITGSDNPDIQKIFFSFIHRHTHLTVCLGNNTLKVLFLQGMWVKFLHSAYSLIMKLEIGYSVVTLFQSSRRPRQTLSSCWFWMRSTSEQTWFGSLTHRHTVTPT